MILGIVGGLGAAFFQSVSFFASRRYAHGRASSARQLVVLSHLWMGLLGLGVLAWEWPGGWGWMWEVRQPALLMTVSYMGGQFAVTLALRYAEASRVSPLLGIKIIFIAGLAAFLPQPQYEAAAAQTVGLTLMQWAGVALSVVAAVALNYAGGAMRPRALVAIVAACVMFTISDWNIAAANRALHAALPGASIYHVSFLNAGLCYVIAGVTAAVLAPFWGTRRPRDWLDAAPYGVMWFTGMMFLFWCFAEVGPLLGVILQSTRGLMSIIMGSLLMYRGHLHIEPHSTRGVLLRRLAAGVLMFLAIGLYVLKDMGNLRI